jgi:hypothetical protein
MHSQHTALSFFLSPPLSLFLSPHTHANILRTPPSGAARPQWVRRVFFMRGHVPRPLLLSLPTTLLSERPPPKPADSYTLFHLRPRAPPRGRTSTPSPTQPKTLPAPRRWGYVTSAALRSDAASFLSLIHTREFTANDTRTDAAPAHTHALTDHALTGCCSGTPLIRRPPPHPPMLTPWLYAFTARFRPGRGPVKI